MDIANTGLQRLADSLAPYAPRLMAALMIVLVAWGVALGERSLAAVLLTLKHKLVPPP